MNRRGPGAPEELVNRRGPGAPEELDFTLIFGEEDGPQHGGGCPAGQYPHLLQSPESTPGSTTDTPGSTTEYT